jgi:hypothetical protein
MNIIRRLFAKYRFVQICLFGLLAFGMLIKPVLFNLSEMHALQHNSTNAISHLDLGRIHDGEKQSPNSKDLTTTNTLHTLIHFTQNCDQSTSIETPCLADVLTAQNRAHLPIFDNSPQKSILPPSVFRPPITV